MKKVQLNTLAGYEMFKNKYYVGDDGFIYSLEKKSFKKLKGSSAKGGYVYVYIASVENSDNKNPYKKILVHRAVAAAFIPNTLNKPEINHIDENKTNNVPSNLEWCTRIENMNAGTVRERISRAHRKPIFSFDLDGNLKGLYASSKQCAEFGFSYEGITQVLKGKRPHYKGRTFIRVEDYSKEGGRLA